MGRAASCQPIAARFSGPSESDGGERRQTCPHSHARDTPVLGRLQTARVAYPALRRLRAQPILPADILHELLQRSRRMGQGVGTRDGPLVHDRAPPSFPPTRRDWSVEQKGFEPSTPKLRRCFRCPTPKLPDGCVSRETLARNSRSVEHEIGKPQGRRRPKAIGPPRVWPLPLRCCGTRARLSRLSAWHDHSAASRRAHGAAYATYIGCWRNHARVAQGQRSIARFEDAKTGSTRSFCSRCGTPLLYERQRSLHMVNIPRALFTGRTGRGF